MIYYIREVENKMKKLSVKESARLRYLYNKTKQPMAYEKFKNNEYDELMRLIKRKLKGGKK